MHYFPPGIFLLENFSRKSSSGRSEYGLEIGCWLLSAKGEMGEMP
jgi:hypothetical protein